MQRATLKSKIAILSVGLAGVLSAPVCADTIPLVPAVSKTIVGVADSSVLAPLGSVGGLVADLAGSFASLNLGNGDIITAPEGPIDGSILIIISGGGASGGVTSTYPGIFNNIPGISSDYTPSNGDPAGTPVPLPGAGLMGMAGLAGVVVLAGRRRR